MHDRTRKTRPDSPRSSSATKQAQDEHDRQVNSILSDIAERRKETRRGGGGLGPIESDRENVAMDVDEPRAGGSGDPSLEPGKGRKK